MPRAYLDAILFACPEHSAETSAFENYLLRLIDLERLHQSRCLELLLSERTPELLASTQSYPFWDSLPGAVFPQRGDVLRIIDAFLNKGTKIEDFLRINDVLLDHASCSPATHLAGRDSRFVEHHHQLLALMCLDKVLNALPECGPIILTSGLKHGSASLQTTGTVVMVESFQGGVPLAVPYLYREVFKACDCSRSAFSALEPVEIWMHEEKYENAIRISVVRSEQRLGRDTPDDSPPFKLGTEFARSIRESGTDQTPARVRALLRACVETILGENMGATHALREGPEPARPPIVRARDGARAMRRDVDYEFHLHYWVTETGPEFSRVVTHNDFRIAE